jgi:hypothetical protein
MIYAVLTPDIFQACTGHNRARFQVICVVGQPEDEYIA